jgi:hypothetical protein
MCLEQLPQLEVHGGVELGDPVLHHAARPPGLEMVDVVPVGLGGGNPTGRGVRLHGVTLTVQIGELVADGGTRYVETGGIEDDAGTHGLAGANVLLDQGPENCVPALVLAVVLRVVRTVVHGPLRLAVEG